jgi:hypothetical protein
LVGAISIFLFCRYLSPPDWVDVSIGPFPEDIESYCLVAEDAGRVEALPWYHYKVISFPEDPSLGGGHRVNDRHGFATESIQWKEASRYGLLIQCQDNQWRLLWLQPQEVRRPSIMRFIIGHGEAEMHLPVGIDRAQVPSSELLKRLGFKS